MVGNALDRGGRFQPYLPSTSPLLPIPSAEDLFTTCLSVCRHRLDSLPSRHLHYDEQISDSQPVVDRQVLVCPLLSVSIRRAYHRSTTEACYHMQDLEHVPKISLAGVGFRWEGAQGATSPTIPNDATLSYPAPPDLSPPEPKYTSQPDPIYHRTCGRAPHALNSQIPNHRIGSRLQVYSLSDNVASY